MKTAAKAASPAKSNTDWIIPAIAVALVFVMLVPLPALFLDVLLAISITMGVLVLLSSLHITKPTQFSIFPTLMLLLTLFRLSLNVASSRRILLNGSEGVSAAGKVIEAFGQFVVGGNYIVGFVIFLLLIAIQYIVISNGAVRTAEVTARFTLDALPGKQMAIDADLNAGNINEAQAKERRAAIAHEAEFYGAMDGATRFGNRDAVATILITAINIIAGFLIGVFQKDMQFIEALKTYTILTVGDGLVTIIPALLVSVASGLVVTRASSEAAIGEEFNTQLFTRPRPLWIAATVLFSLALIPGLPKTSFIFVGSIAAFIAYKRKDAPAPGEKPAPLPGAPKPQEPIESLIKMDDMSLEVGLALVPLVDEKQGGQLLNRIRALRRHMAQQLGLIVPSIHITDNLRLKPREYVVSLRGVEIARWELFNDCLLAISSDTAPPALAGVDTKDPAFGVAAKWIPPAAQENALASGYAVVDQTSVIATHLSEIIKQHVHDLLTRAETKRLLDSLSETQPKLVEELVPKLLSLGEVQKVLQQLLREQVSIRDLTAILETLVDTAVVSKHPVVLVEAVRQALGRSVVRPLLGEDGKLRLATLDPSLEEEMIRAFDPQSSATNSVNLQNSFTNRLLRGVQRLIGDTAGSPVSASAPVLLCSSPARFHLRRLLEPFMPRVVVLSPAEIPAPVQVQSLGMVS